MFSLGEVKREMDVFVEGAWLRGGDSSCHYLLLVSKD